MTTPDVPVLHYGDPAVATIPFTVGGVPTTPTAAVWTVTPPDGSGLAPLTYTYPGAETTVPAVGTLRLVVPASAISAPGRWWVEVASTGAAAAGSAKRFFRLARPGGG